MHESISRNVSPLEKAVCLFVYKSLVLGLEQAAFFTWDGHTSGTTDPKGSRLVTVSSQSGDPGSRFLETWCLCFSVKQLFLPACNRRSVGAVYSYTSGGNKPASLPSSLFSLSLPLSLPLSLSSLLFLTLTCQARVLLNDFERNTQPLIQASRGKASRLFLFVVAALGKGRKSERQPAGGRPWKTAPENSLREARIQRK